MTNRVKHMLLLLAAAVSLMIVPCAALSDEELNAVVSDTAAYLAETVREPQVGSLGGEWAVLGLARSGYPVPEGYYQGYYSEVREHVAHLGGVLHDKKYTEYSRVILGLAAIGVDARDVAGYDLTGPLTDREQTLWQGINGPIYALLALDSRSYPVARDLRQQYVDDILAAQLPDGGWSLSGTAADPDMTGAALQALAKYQDQSAVRSAVERALACMSRQQSADGDFSSWGTANMESCAQVIVALCELGVSLDDPRFIKEGNTLLDGLMLYYQPGAGFRHALTDSGSSQMATEQAFYALVAVERMQEGKNSLYRMDDAAALAETAGKEPGLPGKHPDVTAHEVTQPGKTFSDIGGHADQTAIEALAQRGLVSGKGGGRFDPDATMTRAEFSAIVVTALGLTPETTNAFGDVRVGDWFAPYVGAAHSYGLVSGTGEGQFSPYGTITRQEGACMVAQAARLCGFDTQLTNLEIRNMLAQFSDYITSADWAQSALAFCYRENILDQAELDISPRQAITRGEIAQMIYRLLAGAKLL